ncbi:MAG: MoxR family ATPase [Myxococcota bacterium]|nr:MoxR family ATPase [Myxococcota bacterium]MDW8363178.1 MoxR family ATPase [Myxococcales bacterium]
MHTAARGDEAPESGLAALRELHDAVLAEVGKAVVGQREAIDGLLVALLAQGHALLEGVPGTAKTLMVRAVAAALDLQFGRIQFTPDLMPSDIVGTNVFRVQTGEFHLVRGPIFTELLLADEINRAPAKTQAALLEAMQERQVSIDGERHPLPEHFTVFATQNPIEQEGTYPLPEAQLDRFLLRIRVDYPSDEEEDRILASAGPTAGTLDVRAAGVRPVVGRDQIRAARRAGAWVRVEEPVRRYARDLVRATRRSSMLLLGAGPRAGIHLLTAARWVAGLDGRSFVTPDDVRDVMHAVLDHRVLLAPEVELDGLGATEVLDRIAAEVPVPR